MSIINEAINNRDTISGGASMSGISGYYGPPESVVSGGTGYTRRRTSHNMIGAYSSQYSESNFSNHDPD